MKKLRPATKYHGGKYYLCPWIIEHLPTHKTYIEPFGGCASVLLNKHPSEREIYNDLESGIFSLMLVLKNEFHEFSRIIKPIPYTKDVYFEFKNKVAISTMDLAVKTFITKRMSRGGLCGTFCWSSRMTRGIPAESYAWESMKDQLSLLSERLNNVQMYNKDALEIIALNDYPDTTIYVDPPYVTKTRIFKKAYALEMSDNEHIALAKVLNSMQYAKILVSGYPSELYATLYKSWRCDEKLIANHASQESHKPIKRESLWMNF
jgi:DNA adenine methylase